MWKIVFLASLLFFGISTTTVYGIQLADDLYMALPKDDVLCIDITLPDDSGLLRPGKVEYFLKSTAGDWSDLTDQTVRTDENNTALIPHCLRSFGKQEGDCTDFYTISIESPSFGLDKEFDGGACVSKQPDVDIGSRKQGQSITDILSSNADTFAAQFSEQTYYATPGQQVLADIFLQSTYDVSVSLTPSSLLTLDKTVLDFSSRDAQTLTGSISAPQKEGEYEITLDAKIENCTLTTCSKKAKTSLIVSSEPVEKRGFQVSLFPQSIDTKTLDPITFTLTLLNNEEATRDFSLDVKTPDGLTVDTSSTIKTLEPGAKDTFFFTFTPTEINSFYSFSITITVQGVIRKVSGSISTNELLTDAVREVDALKANATPEQAKQLDAALDQWFDDYKNADAGEDLTDYASFRGEVQKVKDSLPQKPIEPTPKPDPDPLPNPAPPQPEPEGPNILLIGLSIAALVAVVLFVFYKKQQKGGSSKDEYLELEE